MAGTNVLISSAGRRVELLKSWRSALLELDLDGQVLATDMSPMSSAYQVADRAFTVPRCSDPSFIAAMVELCQREKVAVVVPTIDTELAVLAAARDQFEAVGTTVHVSAPETIAICSDKRNTHRWLTESGFPTVEQAEPADVLAGCTTLTYPLIAKPTAGSSSIGLVLARDAESLAMATRQGDYIVQSVAPGVEYTVDVLVDRQQSCRCAVPRRRLEVRAGEVSKAITARVPAVIRLACEIAEALPGAWGVVNIQIFHDLATNALNVIEINPRFGGGFPLTWAAGAHFPVWLLQEILGMPSAARDHWEDGLVMLRYDAAVFCQRESCAL